MSYYLETRVSPHGSPSVIGGQAANGAPLVQYATSADAAEAAAVARASLPDSACDTAGRAKITEINVRPVDHLRIPGRDTYMILD